VSTGLRSPLLSRVSRQIQNRERSDRVVLNTFIRADHGCLFVDPPREPWLTWSRHSWSARSCLFNATRSLRSRFCICRPTSTRLR